jgi:cell cycle arrest protein BUB2
MAFSRPRPTGSNRSPPNSSRKHSGSNSSSLSSKNNSKLQHNNLRLRDRFEQLLKARNVDPAAQLNALRRLVLIDGIPEESITEQTTWTTKCTLRGKIWKVLLGVNKVDAAQYLHLVSKGPSKHASKIDDDLHRTLASTVSFTSRVPQAKICRLLNGYVNGRAHSSTSARNNNNRSTSNGKPTAKKDENTYYVQGMNLLAAPMLYVLPETDAYYAFKHLLVRHCPRYVSKTLEGAHDGAKLTDHILQIFDNELYTFLKKQMLSSSLTLFPTILSLSTNRKPFNEVLRLWDVLFAYGVHLNIIFSVANLILIRNIILSNSPAENQKLLNKGQGMPPLRSELIITLSMHLIRTIPEDLYTKLVLHPFHSLENQYALEEDISALDLMPSSNE